MRITYCTESETGRHYRIAEIMTVPDGGEVEFPWIRLKFSDIAVICEDRVNIESVELAPGVWGDAVVDGDEIDPDAIHAGYI